MWQLVILNLVTVCDRLLEISLVVVKNYSSFFPYDPNYSESYGNVLLCENF